MATDREMLQVIGLAAVNGDFRKKLATNPVQAATDLGFTLTPDQIESIKRVEGKGMAEVLEERLPKMFGNSWGGWG
jgi:hypothetical protein